MAHYELAPDFSITTTDGRRFSRTELEGKVVVLDFWATWCPPCVASVPELKDLTRKFSQDKLVLISVSVDEDAKAWSEFLVRKKMDWPQVRDVDHKIAEIFAVDRFPTYIVIDGEGAIRKRISGMNPQQSVAARIKTELQPIIQGKN